MMFIIYTLDLMGMAIVYVVFAPMILDKSSLFVSADLPVSSRNLIIGALFAAYPITQFFGAPIFGELSDRVGRRPIFLITLIITVISYVFTALAMVWSSLFVLFAARFVGGFFAGNATVAQTAIVDLTDEKSRPRYLSGLMMVAGFGWVIGPYIGSVLSNTEWVSWFSNATPFWLMAIVFLSCLAILYWWVDETHIVEKGAKLHLGQIFINLSGVFKMPIVAPLLLISVLQVIAWLLYQGFMSPYLIERFQFSEIWVGNTFAYFSLWFLVGGWIGSQWLLKKYQATHVNLTPLFLCGLAVLSYLTFTHSSGVWIASAVANGAQALLVGCFFALFGQLASRANQGKVIGFFNAGLAFGAAVMPPVAGWLSRYGINVPFTVSGILLLITAILYVIWYFRYRDHLRMVSVK